MQFKFLITLSPLLLLMIDSCKGQNKNSVFPPEKFSVVQAKLDNGKPVLGSINMAYKNYDKKKEYPWCLTINVALDLKNVDNNGLPVKTESDIANNFEDQLINEIKKLTIVHYIGHLYNDGFLDIYMYIENPEKTNVYLQSQINKKGVTREFAYKIQQDQAGWKLKICLNKVSNRGIAHPHLQLALHIEEHLGGSPFVILLFPYLNHLSKFKNLFKRA